MLVDRWAGYLHRGGAILGAFDGDPLVGMAVVRYKLTANQAELAGLFVSEAYRRQGIAARLSGEVTRLPRDNGARELYVSATPSRSAVGFYLCMGFTLAEKENEELYALEPEDIHMLMRLVEEMT